MNIAIIGSGGREHALAWKLAQSPLMDELYVLPGNGGTPNNVAIDIHDFAAIHQFCTEKAVELIIVGPEAPLAAGITDYFKNTGIKVFGPSQKGAQLESSKIWSKQFMQKYGAATAATWQCANRAEAEAVIHEVGGNLVLKYDGLAAGKGVYVCDNVQDALAALDELLEKYGADAPFLMEERLVGDEISIIGITDGKSIKLLAPSQDHKQLLDGDRGPNTGGMGAYCPVPFCDEQLMQQIEQETVIPTLKGLKGEGLDYVGIIYFGLMITPNGPKLLEYNARLGDPETEVILPALKSDLLALILSCFNGTLADFELEMNEGYFVDVVLTSGGYPKAYQKGYEITGLDKVSADTLVFHAGTKKQAGKIVTNGGRVINMVAHGTTLDEAIDKVYEQCEAVTFKDAFFRKDIGRRKETV